MHRFKRDSMPAQFVAAIREKLNQSIGNVEVAKLLVPGSGDVY